MRFAQWGMIVLLLWTDGTCLASSRAGDRAPSENSEQQSSSLLHYTQAPHIHTQSPAFFEDLLLGLHETPTRIVYFGDSTATDQIGWGQAPMAWRRWLWHLHFGHTPATQLCRLSNFAHIPTAEFMFMGGVLYPHDSKVPSSYLPPGYSPGHSFSQAVTYASGMHIVLNHQNENQLSHGCTTVPLGFYHVTQAINQGAPNFAAGTMAGGKSLIDVSAGLSVEVLAVTHPISAPQLRWSLLPRQAFCSQDPYTLPIQTGLLFGGSQSLAGPLGGAFRAQTPPLLTLSGDQRYFHVNLTGETTDPEAAVQFVGARFLSANPRGLIIDSFSAGQYSALHLFTSHANCGPVIAAGGYACAWLTYGIIDGSNNYTAPQFQQNIQNLIAFFRAATGDASFPVVLETNTMKLGELPESQFYAGALYQISLDDPNVLFINSRRVAEERFGWGTGNEGQYLADGVHYTNAGAQVIARSSIETLLDYFDQPPLPCPGDVNTTGEVNIDDLLVVINSWGTGGGWGPGDIIANGVVDVDDLLVVINSWGPCN